MKNVYSQSEHTWDRIFICENNVSDWSQLLKSLSLWFFIYILQTICMHSSSIWMIFTVPTIWPSQFFLWSQSIAMYWLCDYVQIHWGLHNGIYQVKSLWSGCSDDGYNALCNRVINPSGTETRKNIVREYGQYHGCWCRLYVFHDGVFLVPSSSQ